MPHPTNALGLHIPSDDYVHSNGTELQPLSPTTVNSFAQQPRLTRQDAIDFMKLAKRRLHDRPRVYNEFVLSMKEWQRRVIERPELIGRVRTLFDGYLDLIQGFRMFVPPDYLEDYDNWRFGRDIPPRG
ncbi:hypothetical protein CC1G_06609 [Coprinopsis cinerea okayama7|uniref:Uncharacterized protein n=1 Tax=Coprinopsis cinerea (strain Okayama-7 / 130 / ATCC MYA-4618 / FGSC 9003) TaxID=240176 RepID=A8N2X4_COPC7|nr:hypothetical protein CC1G_06609 [Coprinopsis cinerea okayama7\|eukprot:XP_001829272.1 hypothetical protein CC1G_06609 [Coprinopsis cinerea okayama7\